MKLSNSVLTKKACPWCGEPTWTGGGKDIIDYTEWCKVCGWWDALPTRQEETLVRKDVK